MAHFLSSLALCLLVDTQGLHLLGRKLAPIFWMVPRCIFCRYWYSWLLGGHPRTSFPWATLTPIFWVGPLCIFVTFMRFCHSGTPRMQQCGKNATKVHSSSGQGHPRCTKVSPQGSTKSPQDPAGPQGDPKVTQRGRKWCPRLSKWRPRHPKGIPPKNKMEKSNSWVPSK